MVSRMRLAMLVAACAVIGATLFASAAERSLGPLSVGSWKLDAAKSNYGNAAAPKSELLVVAAENADSIKWNIMGAMPDGKTYFSSYEGPIDGQDHPMKGSVDGAMIAYTRTGSGLKWVVKDKTGAVVETASGVISPDDKNLTIKGTTANNGQQTPFVSVFYKIK